MLFQFSKDLVIKNENFINVEETETRKRGTMKRESQKRQRKRSKVTEKHRKSARPKGKIQWVVAKRHGNYVMPNLSPVTNG